MRVPQNLVVVAAEGGIASAGPAAAWLPVVPDDHVAAHLNLSPAEHQSRDPLVLPVVRDDDRDLGCARSVFVPDEPRGAWDPKLVGRDQRLMSLWLQVEEPVEHWVRQSV